MLCDKAEDVFRPSFILDGDIFFLALRAVCLPFDGACALSQKDARGASPLLKYGETRQAKCADI